MLGDGAKDKGSGLLIEPVLLGKRVDELGRDLVSDDGLGKIIGIVGKATQGESSGLLDGGHIVEEEGAEQLHDTGVLHHLNVLGAGGRLSDSLGGKKATTERGEGLERGQSEGEGLSPRRGCMVLLRLEARLGRGDWR